MYSQKRQRRKETFLRRHRAFTLAELMITMGIIAILAVFVLYTLNPVKQITSAKDTDRIYNKKMLQDALYQYLLDTGGLPAGIPADTTNTKPICRQTKTDATCVNLDVLVPKYVAQIPLDPLEKNANYNGYRVYSNKGRAEVSATYMGISEVSLISGGLVAYWKMDETVAGSALADASGNSHVSVSVVGPPQPSTDRPEPIRFFNTGSLLFNGSSNYVDLGTWLNGTYQSFTISFWVKPAATQVSYANIFDNNRSGGNNIAIEQNNTQTNTFCFILAGCTQLTANQWQHVTYSVKSTAANTYDGSIYINGKLIQPPGVGTVWAGLTANPSHIYLGTSVSNPGRYFNGIIDDLRIYNRALSSGEITNIANGSG